MANKITKKEVITMLLNETVVKDNATYVAYLENELELLSRKAQNKKATKTQEENVGIKNVLVEVLTEKSGLTVTEIMKSNDKLADYSNQKISALLKQLVDDGIVRKVADKKTSRFYLVETE